MSPALSVFTKTASQAPVPVAGKMNGVPEMVWKSFFKPSNNGNASWGKTELRWSSMATRMAFRMRSGTLVGPGT